MADYYPVLTRAIAGLEPNTAEARRAVYERARQAIVKQLRSYDPPLTESEITKERLALEEAVRKIEADARSAGPRKAPEPAAAAAAPIPATPAAPAAPAAASTPAAPAVPKIKGGEGLTLLHAAAAEAASLGAATANAQASASTTRAAFEGTAQEPAPAPRIEPSFERPRLPGPLPAEVDPYSEAPDGPGAATPVETSTGRNTLRGRLPAIAAIAVVLLAAGAGLATYLARDEIAPPPEPNGITTVDTAPKVADRVVDDSAVPSTIAQDATAPAEPQMAAAPSEPEPAAPATPPDATNLVAQRAILYDEAPDKQGGNASSGSVVWSTHPSPDNPSEMELEATVTIPERDMKASLVFTRNLDATLPASHMIEISFDLPPDFANVGVANVPGILFKPTEEAGGSALEGMSVKVTKNVFWIGLSGEPADREQNIQAIRERGWIDLPILYENGRRAVLTIEKGVPGERAFEEAFAAWQIEPPVASTPQP